MIKPFRRGIIRRRSYDAVQHLLGVVNEFGTIDYEMQMTDAEDLDVVPRPPTHGVNKPDKGTRFLVLFVDRGYGWTGRRWVRFVRALDGAQGGESSPKSRYFLERPE